LRAARQPDGPIHQHWHPGTLREILKLQEFSMPAPLIVSDPNVMMGKPVIAGTRITVELVLEELAAGTSVDELIAGHPALTPEAVSAALKFAAGALRADTVYPAPRQSA
jgi:uncharacterized protein (DUF433 family)